MICYLDKSQKAQWLPRLFALYYENMHQVAPSGMSYRQEEAVWTTEVSAALEKAPRQILLCLAEGKLVGYVQYYIRENMLMVEEFQLKKTHQATTAFCGLCRFLAAQLPQELERVESYADRRNERSMQLMERLGMVRCQGEENGQFVRFSGKIRQLNPSFRK